MRFLHFIWNHTLNSVPFGIALMAMIAVYIAVGSGIVSVREYFEMNELQFFSAWPLVVLMILLVLNLCTVTLVRIPFTPPRYGVWCVHVGIVTLIFGMFAYYWRKTEGLMLIPIGRTAEHFYDSFERALYTRVDRRQALPVPLSRLPRFASYPAGTPEAERLNAPGLRDIRPVFMVSQGNEIRQRSLGEELGLTVEPAIDIIGYHPYAEVITEFHEDAEPGHGKIGIRLQMTDRLQNRQAESWLVEGSGDAGQAVLFETMFEHRHAADSAALDRLIEAASRLHRLDILVAGEPMTQFVEVGRSYELGKSGYSITIESYVPNWRTMQGDIVDLLTFLVRSPTMTFRRQVIPGRTNPTDWKLDEPDAGPMGKRQEKPLDDQLKTLYTFNDPLRLLPAGPSEKFTLVTVGEREIVAIHTGRDRAAEVRRYPDGRGEIEVIQMPRRGPFQPRLSEEEIAKLPRVQVSFERRQNIRRSDRVRDIPKAQRDRDEGATGRKQIVTVRVRAGDWSTVEHIPFTQWTAEDFVRWEGPMIQIPGASKPLRLQLGNTLHPMPARVKVERFDLVPYAGGEKSAGSMMRDFRSTLR
ncbi:MAG: hypothetical protein NZ561_07275, partial [Phycisphaerae bacterium]|nr:hypothetical protein [Phycisphaerae bacterium]MDW8263075.1 hypothetical protein [Phycisphaerales bacterium]